MSDIEARMLEYERREQEFFQFINQTRRDQDKPLTSGNCTVQDLSAPKGLQCLLALACLLEETVKVKLNKINSDKDLADLLELRRQAERMGHCEQKALPNANEKHGDNLSLSGEHRHQEDALRSVTAVEYYADAFPEPPKLKTHKSGSNMLSGTLGKMSKLLKTGHVNRESILPTGVPGGTTSSGFAQRKLAKAHGTLPSSLPASAQTSFDLGNSHVSSPNQFGQRHVETPPTPPDLGDIWLGASVDKSRQADDVLPTSTPAHVLVDRSVSLCPHPTSPPQSVDAFVSLPDCLDTELDLSANVELRERRQPDRQTSYRKTHTASYEEAVSAEKAHPTLSPPGYHPQAIYNQSSTDSLDAVDGRTKSLPMESLQHQLDLLNANKNKDFAKKLERWVGKGKQTNKEIPKTKPSSGHPPKTKNNKKKTGKQFNRQRSMSADRAGLLLKESSDEFEEKLRQWGIKQAHDPNYYLSNSGRSRGEKRSVESPARLSRRDEKVRTHEEWVPLKRNSLKRANIEKTTSSSSVSSQTRRSIERGRRVSPTRAKHYTKSTQDSLKGSGDGNSSESGSIEILPGTPTSPRVELTSLSSQGRAASNSISADSLLSTDDNGEIDDDYSSFRRHSLQRPLSMIGMRGSLEHSEGTNPGIQSSSTWSSDSQLLSSSASKDALMTIREDIQKIKEHKAQTSTSSSNTSLEGSFEQIPTKVSISPPPDQAGITNKENPNITPDFNRDTSGVVLPSHSICVDSGMEMKDDEFCTKPPEKNRFMSQEKTNPNTFNQLNETQHTLDKQLPEAINSTAKAPVNTDSELNNQNLNTSDSSQSLNLEKKVDVSLKNDKDTKQTAQQNLSENKHNNTEIIKDNEMIQPSLCSGQNGPIKDNITSKLDSCNTQDQPTKDNVTCEPSLHSAEDQPIKDNVACEPSSCKTQDEPIHGDNVFFPVKSEANEQSSSKDDSQTTGSLIISAETINKPLAHLTAPQAVPLKVKLKRLSTLYDNNEMEDIKTLNQELSDLSDVFTVPETPSRERSKSEPKLDEPSMEKKAALTGKHSNPGQSVKDGKLFVETAGLTAMLSTSQQSSPVSRRRRLHSPVPVLDLVNKFDQQKSSSSSPAVSPTHSQPPIAQMGKIVDRLIQPKGNPTNRYTVDLSRHVREVPKEGAVQRARSIFMDLQSS